MSAPLKPIQVLPPGLLGMLQLKTGGNNPDTIMGEVRPTIDLLDFYLRAISQPILVTPTATPGTKSGQFADVYTTNNVLVPQSEWWWVESYLVFAGGGVGSIVRDLKPVARLGGNPNGWMLLGDSVGNINVPGTGADAATVGARGFWLPPGSAFGFSHSGITAGAGITVTGRIQRSVAPV